MKHFYISFLALLQCTLLFGHGFGADTLVLLANNSWQEISTICYRAQKKKIPIASYDTTASFQTTAQVVRGGRSQTNCYIRLGFAERLNDSQPHLDVTCTPTQEFYNASTRQWVPTYMLKIGDQLLCAHSGTKTVTSLSLIKEPLPIFTMQVKHTHTFFVTQHALLTHNMVLPIAFNIGLSIPFGASAGGTAGSFFGPATFVVGAAVGCMVGALVKIACGNKIPRYTVGTYDANAFEQQVKQQPISSNTFSEPQITLSPNYNATQENSEVRDTVVTDAHNAYTGHSNGQLFSTTLQNPSKEIIGCGDTTPHKPLILVTPAEPMPVFQCPGYRPLSDEERKMFSGGCTGIPIIEPKKEDTIICGGITPVTVNASNLIMAMSTDDAQSRWAESDKMKELEKRIKELTPMISRAKPGNWLKTNKPSPVLIKDFEWAEKTYEKIRNSNDDLEKIAANLGLSKNVIETIKNHLFITQHKRSGKIAAFEADYDIAKAWERLTAGSFVKADLVLLRHELAEALIMGQQEMHYEEAHKIVEKLISWQSEL